ncbi:MAG: site-2 protease family protein [Clostridiales bacterium]|nr:site-2 protease family protein [Clostridiales bacterium]
MRKSGSFVFIFFIAIMLLSAFQSGRFANPAQWLQHTLIMLPAIVIGITLHEFAHAYAAWKLGDKTPQKQGRITLNPLAHIDPIGLITLIFVGFGWGRPVQVNPYAFKGNRRAASLIVNVAGVITNFIVAFLCTATLFFVRDPILFMVLYNIVAINLMLMIFNLLPVPPLDGFGIITELFDLRRFSWYAPLYNNGTFILLALIIFGITGMLLGPAMGSLLTSFQKFWAMIL